MSNETMRIPADVRELAVEVIRLNTALALLKTEENAAHVEAVATNAAWLEELERIAAFATRTPALRLDAALRSEASGQGGIHPDPETWRCRQCGGYAAHYRDCPALRSEARGEESVLSAARLFVQQVRAAGEDRFSDFGVFSAYEGLANAVDAAHPSDRSESDE